MRLHLVLTHHWFDEIAEGRKFVEYRAPSERWMRLIYSRRSEIIHVRFARGYTKQTMLFPVRLIDIGKCPYEGWQGNFIRIHFDDPNNRGVRSNVVPEVKE
ncbi:MAG: hypothetical protein WCS52_01815 [bacterium]